MLGTRFLVCLVFVSIHTVVADDCRFPINIPAILSIDEHAGATTSGENPDYGCTVTFSDEYPIVDVMLAYSNQSKSFKTEYLPIRETEEEVSRSMGRHQVSFHSEKMVKSVSLTVTFDIGCTQLVENLQIKLNNNKSFTGFLPGKLINMPQPEIIFELDKPVEIDLVIETAGDIDYSVYFISYVYRSDSGAVIAHKWGVNDPIFIRTVPLQESPNGPRQEWTGQFTVPKGIKDVTVRANFIKSDYGDVLVRFAVGYYITFHTGEKTTPGYVIKQCNYNDTVPTTSVDLDGNAVVLLQQQIGLAACLQMTVDGNPLPEVALVEVSSGRALKPYSDARLSVMVYDALFIMDKLKEDEVRDFILQIGDLRQRIRIEAIVRARVDGTDN